VADGRHFEKPLNRHNSATVRLIAVKFGMTTHFDPPMPSDGQNFEFLKIQHGGRPMPGHVRGRYTDHRTSTVWTTIEVS